MEEKEQNTKEECLFCDETTGTFYRASMERVNMIQMEIEAQLRGKGHVTYNDLMDILTQGLTPEQKIEYLMNHTHGWQRDNNTEEVSKLAMHSSEMEDGKLVIHVE